MTVVERLKELQSSNERDIDAENEVVSQTPSLYL